MFWWKKPKINETDNTPNKQQPQSRLSEVYQELSERQQRATEVQAEIQDPNYQQKQWEKREKWSGEKSLVLLQRYVSNVLKAEGVPVNQNPVQINGMWFGAEEEVDGNDDIEFSVHLYRPCQRCGKLTSGLRLGGRQAYQNTNLSSITSYLHNIGRGYTPEPICKNCRT